jgi:hypothetical protein
MSFRPTTVLENIMALIVLKTRILASLKIVEQKVVGRLLSGSGPR